MSMGYKNWRTLYYLGILAIVVNALPTAREYLAPVFNFEVVKGIDIIAVIALLTGIGAFMAYQRKFG